MIFIDLIVDPEATYKDPVGDADLWDLDCDAFTDYYEDEDKHLKYGVRMFASFNIFTVWLAPRSDFRVRENLEVYLMHVRYKADNNEYVLPLRPPHAHREGQAELEDLTGGRRVHDAS